MDIDMIRYFGVLLFFATMIITSCSDKTTNPANGNGTNTGDNAAVVKTNLEDLIFKLGYGYYDVSYGYSDLSFTSFVPTGNQNTTGFALTMSFRGNKTGNLELTIDNKVQIMKDYIAYTSLAGTGSINITKYGNVGQMIEGTFTGQFKSVSGTDTFTVTSATFSAKRLEDEDDGDINSPNSSLTINMTTIEGNEFSYTNDKMDGAAAYQEQGKILSLTVQHKNNNDEFYTLGISIFVENIEPLNNQNLKFEGNSNISLLFTYLGMPYKFIGTAAITNFAKSIGEKFEVNGSGEFFSLVDGSKAGDIHQFSLKVERDY